MSGILIVAYGNPLRCDDGLAWQVAQQLAEQNLSGDCRIITCYQLAPELAQPVSQAATVLFIDAARGGVPGEITSGPLKPQRSSSAFTHEFSPGAILRIAEELYGSCAKAFTISLCGECFDHGEKISATVEESLPRVVTLVSEFLQRSRDPQRV